ncbi:MAG: DUF2110 family protein [Candidatus Bathyarchaeota archaeon]|jgi:hypothetical protein|nr:DUF2110 family protein [Candidatus Bathyarchaeota archaeon A05DMB-5]MDH7557147.1 DUF2110 family protein [Candidatus Bathyarchaeota archaeon]
MHTVTLSVKAYNNFHLKYVNKFLENLLKDLRVEAKVCGVAPRGWVQVNVSGEDEQVALRYLADEVGLCPTHLKSIGKFSLVKGRIVNMDKRKDKLSVDVGIFAPEIVDATVPLQHLQAQLADGRKVALQKIAQLYGFQENLPLTVKISNVDEDGGEVETVLSEKQLTQYKQWTKSLQDRLIILGATLQEIQSALKTTGMNRDVVSIGQLGLFEYAIACKLGTDAVGLISKIGKKLPTATLSVFNPKKIIEPLEDNSAF